LFHSYKTGEDIVIVASKIHDNGIQIATTMIKVGGNNEFL
jgi:hypothetical protein